jgi:hypothetical protein
LASTPRRSSVITRPLLIFVPGWGKVTIAPPAAQACDAAKSEMPISASGKRQARRLKHIERLRKVARN